MDFQPLDGMSREELINYINKMAFELGKVEGKLSKANDLLRFYGDKRNYDGEQVILDDYGDMAFDYLSQLKGE